MSLVSGTSRSQNRDLYWLLIINVISHVQCIGVSFTMLLYMVKLQVSQIGMCASALYGRTFLLHLWIRPLLRAYEAPPSNRKGEITGLGHIHTTKRILIR